MYTENYKTLLRVIKDDLNEWSDTPCSWFERFSIVKTGILLKLISVEFLSKLQKTLFQRN